MKSSKWKSPLKSRKKLSQPSEKVKPSPEVIEFIKQRPFLSKALIRHVVAEDPNLAEAG